MYVNNHYYQQEVYASAAHGFDIFEWWNASLATDFQWNTLDADLVDFAYPTRNTLLTAAATAMRFRRLRLQGSLLYTYVHDRTRSAGGAAPDKHEWTPTVVALIDPIPGSGLNIRTFYKRIFRMPTLNDLYYTFIGNKYLNPEYTTQYDVGVAYTRGFAGRRLRSLDVQADAYYNEVEDKIIAMPTSNQFQWTMINLGHVEIRGIDLSVQTLWAFGPVGVRARVSYTYQQAQDRTDPASEWYGGQIPYIPWHSGSAILGAAWRGWDLNYSFIYTGERYESVANIRENYAQPWYTHDLSLAKTIALGRHTLRVTAEVNNLFNQQYEVVQCYPMPGTNIRIKINFTL